MKTLLSLALVLLAATALAQDAKKDTTYSIPFTFNSADTAGMGQYGMRIYDPRIARYMPADTTLNNTAANPYRFVATRKKKPVKNHQ